MNNYAFGFHIGQFVNEILFAAFRGLKDLGLEDTGEGFLDAIADGSTIPQDEEIN